MKALRWSLLCVGAVLLAACEVPAGSSLGEGANGYGSVEQALEPGERLQGTELHGTSLERVSLTSGSLGGQSLLNLRLEKGGLVADRNRVITSTTMSLNACSSATSGESRSCGFSSQGVGTCRPGYAVTLSSSFGACMGYPVARVCSGTAACEYTSRSRLASDSSMCSSGPVQVSFTCPTSGTYNVMAGPYTTGNLWQLKLVASEGAFPAKETLRGGQLEGAVLSGSLEGGYGMSLALTDIINANTVQTEDSPNGWDSTGNTWLYRVQARIPMGSGYSYADVCSGPLPYAVPVGGIYDAATGARSESTTQFTFGCNDGVIAKCYRWGYQPWKDVDDYHWAARMGHVSCTRMARADYCGDGTSHTQDGTRILPWDEYSPQVIAHPGTSAAGMAFEAGWNTGGAECLSHWRWQTLQTSCVKLKPPIYENGQMVNRCQPGQKELPDGGACANVCDSPEEAEGVFHARLYNESLTTNGADGGVPDGGM
jgi:hypothetical protein